MKSTWIVGGVAAAALLLTTACNGNLATAIAGNVIAGGNGQPTAQASPGTNGKVVKEVQVAQQQLSVTQGQSRGIDATVIYTDGTRDTNINLISSDDTIITANSTNKTFSAIKAGTATLEAVAATDTSKKAVVTVTVRPGEVTEGLATITPTELEMTVGGTETLDASIKNSDGSTSASINWTSSDTSVVKITGTGGTATVLAVGEGTATITAKGSDSTVSAKSKVTVKKKGE